MTHIKMKIKAIHPESFIDYDKGLSTVLFVGSCPYKCPSCHAKNLLESNQIYTEQETIEYLESRKKLIDKIVISGGEPTKELGLINFLTELKKRGFNIKLDTNGFDYVTLLEIKNQGLVDFVAMDVKGPFHLYSQLTGTDKIDKRDLVEKPISIVSQFPAYEFRTTIVPVLNQGQIRWLTPEEIRKTAELIYDSTGSKDHKYFLQGFVAPPNEEVIDINFSKEHLPKDFHKTPAQHLEACVLEAQKILPNTETR